MADITIGPLDLARTGNGINVTDNDTAVSSAHTYFVVNNGRVILLFTNGAGANTLTVETTKTVDGLSVTDLTATFVANKLYAIGTFPADVYNDAVGRLKFTVSAAAECLPLRVP